MSRPPLPSRSPAVPAEAPRPLRALLFADASDRGAALAQRLAHGGMQAALAAESPAPSSLDAKSAAPGTLDAKSAAPGTLAAESAPRGTLAADSATPAAESAAPGALGPPADATRDACDALLLHLDWPLHRLVPLLVALRERSGAPIALLREQGDDEDDVAALEAGFDAAWQSAIDDRVLWARLRALVRGTRRAPAPPPSLALGRLRVDLQASVASIDARLLRFTRTQFELLVCLAAQPGTVVSRSALLRVLAASLGPELRVRALDSALSRLRLRLAAADAGVRIVAVPRRGYRLDVTRADAGGPALAVPGVRRV